MSGVLGETLSAEVYSAMICCVTLGKSQPLSGLCPYRVKGLRLVICLPY